MMKFETYRQKIIDYFNTKIKDSDIEKLNIDADVIEIIDQSRSKIKISIYLLQKENRLICCLDDLEIIDEYDGNIDEIIMYLDYIISHEILQYEKYCKEKLISRYYEFYHKINNKEEKVKLFSVNKFSIFCKKQKNIKNFKPW